MIYAVLVILVVFSAFFSALETGLLSLGEIRIRKWAKEKIKALDIWLRNPAGVIGGILIGNNIVNITFSALVTVLVVRFIRAYAITRFGAEIISIICSATVILVFGEIIPKTFANTHPEKIVKSFYGPFTKFYAVSRYLSDVFNKIAFSIIGISKIKKEKIVSRKELNMILEDMEESGIFKKDSSRMLVKVLVFARKTVGELMTSRKMIYAVDIKWDYAKIIDSLLMSPYSRIPAYEDNLDKLRGVIYIKDVIGELNVSEKVDFIKILRKPLVTYAGRNSQHLFHEFRNKRIHCAVVESNKRIIGFITIEDLIEEVVGEIYDEYDHRVYTG